MNEVVIRAERVGKRYKLYETPRQRLFDMLGLGRAVAGRIRYHEALSELSFTIRRGEKVAVIGRNGAGKSTLLKLVSQVITPTCGRLEVRGNARALLSLGSGFHPEFSGRQNATAYLAGLGFAGARLQELVERALDFAELEDYADQPLKTYSTGMAMRIMFAAATVVRPDLFVIDEVLGVGDAYFQQKSFKHLSDICAAGETTLLLVTHDIYSAAQLCDRMLWLDRGRLLIDGPPEIVMRAYQDSIREQEERRLRAKSLVARGGSQGQTRRILVEIQSAGNRPPPAPLHIASLSVLVGGVQIATAPMTDLAFGGDGTSYLVAEGSNWGEPEWVDGRLGRPLRTYGSPFHKVTAAFHLHLEERDLDRLGVRIVAHTLAPGRYVVRLHAEGWERTLGDLAIAVGKWSETTLLPPAGYVASAPMTGADGMIDTSETRPDGERAADARPEAEGVGTLSAGRAVLIASPSVNIEGRYGSGDVEILTLRAFDDSGRERHVIAAGSAVRFVLEYRLRRPDLRERLSLVLAFKRDGVVDVARTLCEDLEFNASTHHEGAVSIDFARFPLGAGRYAVTALVAKADYYRQRQTVFFTINPAVYDVRVGLLELEVEETSQIYSGTGTVLDARWSRTKGT